MSSQGPPLPTFHGTWWAACSQATLNHLCSYPCRRCHVAQGGGLLRKRLDAAGKAGDFELKEQVGKPEYEGAHILKYGRKKCMIKTKEGEARWLMRLPRAGTDHRLGQRWKCAVSS